MKMKYAAAGSAAEQAVVIEYVVVAVAAEIAEVADGAADVPDEAAAATVLFGAGFADVAAVQAAALAER